MTLGVQTACLEQYPLEEVLDFLQKTGIRQVELISGHLMYKKPRRIAKMSLLRFMSAV